MITKEMRMQGPNARKGSREQARAFYSNLGRGRGRSQRGRGGGGRSGNHHQNQQNQNYAKMHYVEEEEETREEGGALEAEVDGNKGITVTQMVAGYVAK